MRAIALTLALLAAGCGGRGPVTEAEFRGFLGKTVDQALERMGPADDKPTASLLLWRGKVLGKDGKMIGEAGVSFDHPSMRISWISLPD